VAYTKLVKKIITISPQTHKQQSRVIAESPRYSRNIVHRDSDDRLTEKQSPLTGLNTNKPQPCHKCLCP